MRGEKTQIFCTQVVSYIGKEGSNVQVNAAASLCPAWDISSAFRHLQQRHPWVDRYVTRGIVNHFLGYVPFLFLSGKRKR